MSSDEPADDDEDLGHIRFIRMRAEDTFDGQERVMSRAAWDPQVLAASHSASCGHPGFAPDDYLEHLDGLSIETTITAAELCTCGIWERVDSGYRVLDWEAVEVRLDQVRQRRGEDPQAVSWEREREARVQAHMAQPIVVSPPCAVCGTASARIEVVAPGQLPAEWEQWSSTVQASIVRQSDPGQWYLLFKGIAMYNGYGGPIDASRAGRIAWAFRPPLCFALGPHGQVLRRCRILPVLRRSILLPALARVRVRVRLLPPQPRQEPGPALVAVRNRSLMCPDQRFVGVA